MRSKPIAVNIDGVKDELHSFLLYNNDRPAPKQPSHYVVADVISTDLAIKRITIYFNPDDTWANQDFEVDDERLKWIGKLIGENLAFLGRDPNTVAYFFWVLEARTNYVIYKSSIHSYCDYDAA